MAQTLPFHSIMLRARYVWIVIALSPRDGGWVRMFGKFRTENDAWRAVHWFLPLMELAGDYVSVDVVKTISFHGRVQAWRRAWRRRWNLAVHDDVSMGVDV